jgi:hypothetical protein
MRRYFLSLLVLGACCSGDAAAMDDGYGSILSLRARKYWSEDTFSEFTLHSRFADGIEEFNRLMLEATIAREVQRFEFSAGYHLQTFRQNQPGQEHRFWQQLRYRLPFAQSYVDFYTRIEERYFNESGRAAVRNRSAAVWYKNLTPALRIGFGDEVVFNLDSLGTAIRSGFDQNRLLAGVRYRFSEMDSIDLNYQLRFVDDPVKPDYRYHLFQLILIRRF